MAPEYLITIRASTRWIGFRRTGPAIDKTARSQINSPSAKDNRVLISTVINMLAGERRAAVAPRRCRVTLR